MIAISNLYLDTLCYALLSRALDYYVIAGNIFNIMYMAGCRREEAVSFNLWGVIDINTVYLNPLKGNNQRTFTADELPEYWFDAIQTGVEPYPDFRISKVNYYIKLLQLEVLYTDGKQLLSNQFRHNYAKKLYYSGFSYEEIRVKMGENTLSVVQGYINDSIFSQANIFLEIPFTSTQAQFFTTSSNNYIRSTTAQYFAINYADNSNPLFTTLPINSNYNFPSHTFSSPFGSTVSKQVTFFISQNLAVTQLALNTTYFQGSFPSAFQNLINLSYLYLRFMSFTSIANLYINSTNLSSVYFAFLLSNSAPTNANSFNSLLFSGSFTSFILIGNAYSANYPLDNVALLQYQTSLTTLYLDRYFLSVAPINFSGLSILQSFTLDITSLTGNTLPATLANIVALQTIVLSTANLQDFATFDTLTGLKTIIITYSSSLTTNWPTELNSLTELKTLFIRACYTTQLRFDNFIDSFYSFIDTNASKTVGNTQFRQMRITLDGNSLTPSGTFQAPAGYVQGTSNGTPTSQNEKVWVMVNQYAHVWTF